MAYEKQQWDTTSYVNPTRMNHIEDGIKANSDAVDQNASDISSISSDLQGQIDEVNSNLTNWATSDDLVIQYPEKDTKTINLNNINAKEFTVLCQGGVVRVIIKIPNYSLGGSRYFYAGASNGTDNVYCVCKVTDGILSYISIQKQGVEQTDGHMRVLY